MDIDAVILHSLFPYFLVIGIFSLVALFTWLGISTAKKEEKKRTNELKDLALRSGFSFSENVDINMYDFGEFEIFRNRADIKLWNMLTKAKSGFEMKIFDYRSGSGKNAKSHGVFMVKQTNSSLPTFVLKKKKYVVDKVLHHGIVFDKFKEFFNEYILDGENERSIRNVFNENVIRHFENHKLKPDATIATNGNRIVYYQWNRHKRSCLKPEALLAQIEEVNELLSVFMK